MKKLERLKKEFWDKYGARYYDEFMKDLDNIIKVAMGKEKKEEDVCEYCRGSGEIPVDENDGEGHIMVGVGTQKCICQIK